MFPWFIGYIYRDRLSIESSVSSAREPKCSCQRQTGALDCIQGASCHSKCWGRCGVLSPCPHGALWLATERCSKQRRTRCRCHGRSGRKSWGGVKIQRAWAVREASLGKSQAQGDCSGVQKCGETSCMVGTLQYGRREPEAPGGSWVLRGGTDVARVSLAGWEQTMWGLGRGGGRDGSVESCQVALAEWSWE